MTTTDARKLTGPPLFLLPVVVMLALFGGAALVAEAAPGMVTTGIYQVYVSEGSHMATIPLESLSCTRTGDTSTCTAPAGPAELTVSVDYTGELEPGPCTARHGDRPVECVRLMGFYGHGSYTLQVTGLGLTETQLTELRDAGPWWRDNVTDGAMVLIVTLSLAVGVITFLLRGRARPVTARVPLTIATGVLGLGLFLVNGALITPAVGGVFLMLNPFTVMATLALAGWQWELTTASGTTRLQSAVVAWGATAFYASVVAFIVLLQSGFID